MRTDSFAKSTLEDGALLTGNIGAGTTINQWTVTQTGYWLLAFAVACDVSFSYYARVIDVDGTTILKNPLYQSASGTDWAVYPTPIYLVRNQIVRLVSGTTIIPATGLQGNIFPTLSIPGVTT